MAQRALLLFLCALGVLHTGLSALIHTQQIVVAAVGEEAHFSCQLNIPKDVLQVTWQKILPDGEKNLCTYNSHTGQKVNPGFRDKIEFIDAGLQRTSIVIRNLVQEDEGCYHCLFNTDPDGALTGKTCLQLYELHDPVLHVTEAPAEAVVSCSATGRPAPTVTLTVPHNSSNVTNTNGSVTVTVTAVVPRLRGNSTHVGCAVRVLSSPPIEVFTEIPESSDDGFDGVLTESASGFDFTRVIVLSSLGSVAVVCVFAVVFRVLRLQKRQKRLPHRDSENSVTPQKTSDTHELQTLRKRTPKERNQTEDDVNPLSPTARRLF